MAKLKNIIKQLSPNDYKAIFDSLNESGAEKSAYLLESLRDRQLSDNLIMKELGVNTNAYYTLRSRLNQKIEEHLLQQMENPRTDILKKVANINEIIFTKKRAISLTTLKKLEKELLDYDLSNELTIVYKSLKKLHQHSDEYFSYSQLYNRHVAYTLAVDKAEDLLAEYFKKYGHFRLSGDETTKLELDLLLRELTNVRDLYESHRLYIYHSCVIIFHRLFVLKEENMEEDDDAIEDILNKAQHIFESYPLDSIYYHINLVFAFLKLEYYLHYKVYRKAEHYYEEINDAADNLLMNYSLYTFPAQFLLTKLERALRLETETTLFEESDAIFTNLEMDFNDFSNKLIYNVYRAISSYYAAEYHDASKWLNECLNEPKLKKYPMVQVEVKTLQCMMYCLLNEYELFQQLVNSVQRQIRSMGKEACPHVYRLIKSFKIAISPAKRKKFEKIETMLENFPQVDPHYFAPTLYIRRNETFIKRLVEKSKVA